MRNVKDNSAQGRWAASGCHSGTASLQESFFLPKSLYKQNNRNQHTHPGEPVTETGVEGDIGSKIVGQIDGATHIARNWLINLAIRIDGGGEAAVGDAQDPPAIFHCAHARHEQMLLRSGRFAEPAVVRNVYEKVCASLGELANFARIDRFIANEHAEFIAAGKLTDRRDSSFVKTANLIGNALHHAVNQGKRLVLSKRNEVALIVDEDSLSLRVDEYGAVVRRLAHVAGEQFFGFPFHDPRQKRMPGTNSQAGGKLRELVILPRKWRGSFRPDNQIGMMR